MKRQLDYSEEAKEKMYEQMLDFIKTVHGSDMTKEPVTVSTLKHLTSMDLTEDTVAVQNDYLTKEYKHIVSMYGFDNFHDLFLYALQCEQDMEVRKDGISRNKDTDRLSRVTRTVIRNGRPMQMTLYEDPEAEARGRQPSMPDSDEMATISSNELTKAFMRPLDEEVRTKDVAQIQKWHKQFRGQKDLKWNATNYLVFFRPNEVEAQGFVGFKIKEDSLEMCEFDGAPEIGHFDRRVIMELITIALETGSDLHLLHTGTKTFDLFVEDLGIKAPNYEETENYYYSISHKDLAEAYGFEGQVDK